jgi:membrane-bound ClpP family serine protease
MSRFQEGNNMFATIAAILVVLWLLGFLAFHVAGGLIHILLVVAVIMVVLHFVRGSRAV